MVDFDTPVNVLKKETSVLKEFLDEKEKEKGQDQNNFIRVANSAQKFSTEHFQTQN